MELRPGYKQTEVGVIPEDWTVVELGRLLKGTPSYGINAAAIAFDSQFPTYLRITDINEDGRFVDASKVSVKHPAADDYALEMGDLVFARTGASVGKSYLYDQKDGRLIFAGFLIRVRPNGENLIPGFLRFYTQSRPYWDWIKANSMRSGQPGINGREYSALPVALPPTRAEQEAIAEVLSDADALIESLEQLLAKKRQLKQGVMQELLTGKKRLPGFSGEWEVKRLGELGRWTGGMTPSMRNAAYWRPATVPWISSGDVKSLRLFTTAFGVSEYAVKQNATTVIQTKSIVIVARSGILRKYLPVAMTMAPMAINQDVKALLPTNDVLADYLLHALNSVGDRILARCLKSGTTVESIEFSWLKAFTISIPSLPEQTAIATILSDMDAEIDALDARLAKARALKQGMMQELLTGAIRLPC